MKKLLVLHTGGTISMQTDENGAVSSSSLNPMTLVTSSLEGIQITSQEVYNLPSPHVTFQHMLQLYHIIQTEAVNYDGFVITHGTDTLEETAYFLDTVAMPRLPIVLTGAMRSSNELGSDGIYNYISALRVAADDYSADKGVLLVMNDEIHAAKYVTKTHTTSVSTFQTPIHGPLGIVTKREILYFKGAEPKVGLEVKELNGLVPIITTYADMDSLLLDSLTHQHIAGLVIEAMGAGNLPPAILPSLTTLIERKIPILLVSRCFNGIAEPVYAYQGGGVELKQMGLLFVKELNAAKARIKLLIALNAGLKGQALAEYIEN